MAKILLVDDEGSVLKTMGMLLESEGHNVVPCTDGQQAMKEVQSGDFDLLITDIRMAPVDGMEILKRVHDEQPSLPIIVISAYSSDKTARQSMEMGCTAYIKKPFKIQEVLDAINRALSGKKINTQ